MFEITTHDKLFSVCVYMRLRTNFSKVLMQLSSFNGNFHQSLLLFCMEEYVYDDAVELHLNLWFKL